jgi:hypothetical protein
MNCLEVRRQALVDPRLAMRMADGHLSGCAPCSDFMARTTLLEREIAQALAVPGAPQLQDRILDRTLNRPRRRRLLLAAASLVLGSSVIGFLSFERNDPMALAGIDFVVDEEASAILAAVPPDMEMLARAVGALQIHLPPQLGDLRYIGTCPFQGKIACHLIAMTPLGKVTLLLLPDQPVEKRQYAHARGLRAMVRAAGEGSIAIIGDSMRSLERICRFMFRA